MCRFTPWLFDFRPPNQSIYRRSFTARILQHQPSSISSPAQLLHSLIYNHASRSRTLPITIIIMPDLNSVPASPHALSGSRRPSAAANDMPPPSPSLNILPSNQLAVENARRASNASLHSPQLASAAPAIPTSQVPPHPQAPHQPISTDPNSAVTGPGPVRHPRPLTAAELHAQLEKEQEAVVCVPIIANSVLSLLIISVPC